MNSKNILLILCCFLTFVGWGDFAFAQSSEQQQLREKRYTLYFKLNQFNIDSKYKDNGATISRMVEDINKELEHEGTVPANLHIIASASPEGPLAINRNLALRRAEQAKKLLVELFPQFKEDNIEVETIINSWDGVIQSIENDPQLKYREELLIILKDESLTNQQKDQAIRNIPEAFEQIRYSLMDNKRTASITFTVYDQLAKAKDRLQPVPPFCALNAKAQVANPAQLTDVGLMAVPKVKNSHRFPTVTLKTNFLGLGLGHINLAAEIDFAKHWSLALPFYYSGGFDYFKSTIKFRGIIFQPEIRFYPVNNDGFFIGAHYGMSWYNLAVDGQYRIQDHKGKTPAMGGGLSLGYAFNFGKTSKWGMEFSIGGGVYDARYDKFYNEENGPYAEHGVRTTYMGVDNASISLTYTINPKRGGGR